MLWQLWVLVVATGLLSASMDGVTLCVFIPDRASLFLKTRMVYMSFGKQPSARERAALREKGREVIIVTLVRRLLNSTLLAFYSKNSRRGSDSWQNVGVKTSMALMWAEEKKKLIQTQMQTSQTRRVNI